MLRCMMLIVLTRRSKENVIFFIVVIPVVFGLLGSDRFMKAGNGNVFESLEIFL